ncbi:MAG: hypothetical protein JSR76_04425 [Verrucomicrobia bacterium]|nr:hypothetical protein [Verrucomicrobiota bacterium]
MKKSTTEDPSILEAVDNLSSMAELDIEELKVEKKEGDGGKRLNRWLDLKDETKTLQSVKGTFKTIHKYLQHIYSSEGHKLKDIQVQKGVRSIITLAQEAAAKIEATGLYFKGKETITHSKEYADLMDFYEKKILKKFEDSMKLEEDWQEELKREEDAAEIEKRGLKDLESIMRDRDYELFFITKEDGTKFYNRNLIRHIRLVANFDQLIENEMGDDPLLKIKTIQDKETHTSALHFKEELKADLNQWFREAGKFRNDEFIRLFYCAMMALFLASSSRNLLSKTTAKSSLAYFNDFQFYLREALSHVDYQKIIDSGEKDGEPFYNRTIEILHKLAFFLFTNALDKKDSLSYFTRIIQKESSLENKSKTSSLFLWNNILDEHEELHAELMKFPSGPLFKILDVMHEQKERSFDPFMQQDRPEALFQIELNSRRVLVTRMGCPTLQRQIQEAKIIPEFKGALRHASRHGEKILLVNYQDRTSWKEYARTKEIEELQNKAEVKESLDVVTLPKSTDFYLQSEDYLKATHAEDFKKMLFEQITSSEGCGFSFPHLDRQEEFYSFIQKAIELTHTLFFGKKEELSRKNRLDFIEIVYQWILVKLLIETKATVLAFCGKDGVDLASTASFGFYAFLKLLGADPNWREEEKDFLNVLVFIPALLTRERVVDRHLLSRLVSMLSVVSGEIEVDRTKVEKAIGKLGLSSFSKGIFVHPLF